MFVLASGATDLECNPIPVLSQRYTLAPVQRYHKRAVKCIRTSE